VGRNALQVKKVWEANMELAADATAATDAPMPAPVESAIDFEHLARMTLGEPGLEAEVLTLFDRQAEMLLERMRDAPPKAVAAFAHTLKGSARGIGAWRVAAAADAVEMNAARSYTGGGARAAAQLAAAVDEARAAIADRLHRGTGRE
jgi:HPt (histidine-containing phosphotransfer) domain-containing protein